MTVAKLRSVLCLGAFTVTGSLAADASPTAALVAPAARTVDVRELRHGREIADPYRWMEEPGSAEVAAWAAAQNGLAEEFAGAASAGEIAARILRYSSYAYENQFHSAGGRTFFLRGAAGSPYTGLWVRDADGRERLLEGPRVGPDGNAPPIDAYARSFWPSPDGARLAILRARRGDNFGRLALVDASTGNEIALLAAESHNGGTTAAWSHDGGELYFTHADREGERTPVRNRTSLFALATGTISLLAPPFEDRPGRAAIQSVRAAIDRPHVFVELLFGSSGTTEIRRFDRSRPEEPGRSLFPPGSRWHWIGSRGDAAWFYTNAGAPRGRIVRWTAAGPDGPDAVAPVTIVPESAEAMAAGSLVGGDAYGMFGDFLVMLFQGEGGATLRAFDLAGRLVRERPIPSSGSLWGNLTGDPRQPSFYFQFLGVADPATVYRFELPTGEERIVAAPALPFAPGAFVATRHRVRGKDGVEIPVLVSHRAGLALDRPRPLVLYAYGAFGWNSFLWYQPWLAEWFLEQGGIFAVAGVRGGGEQGESWHEAGRRRNRQNAVDDALAVADWLIDRGHTDARRLVFNSSSIAGSLGGSVVAQRPELFGAALLDYPVLDLLRYLEFGQARSWLEELGDPGDPGDFEVLRRLSPYEAAARASCPPPILVRPGAVDPVVTPVHAFKYVARMQATTGTAKPAAGRATCGPVLLDVLEGAGHDYGGTPAEIAKSHAVALAFLKRVLPR